MYKLMIVDDDEYIRSGIKHLLSWDELGITIVGEAGSGKSALEQYKTLRPHIVITDIRMPKGDGLELIRNVKQIDQSVRFVVLSGYDDFSYARKAIQLNVEDYLLKPINEDELKRIMVDSCEKLGMHRIQEQLKRESLQLLRNETLLKWTTNLSQWNVSEEKLNHLGIELTKYASFQAGIVFWKKSAEGKLSETEQVFRSFAIHNAIDEAMHNENKGITFINNDKHIVCLFFSENNDLESFSKLNLQWLNVQGQMISKTLKTPWFSTLGTPCSHPEFMNMSYEKAIQLQNHILDQTDVMAIDSNSLDISHLSDAPQPSFINHENILRDFLSGSSQRWIEQLEEDFKWVTGNPEPILAAKFIATEWTVSTKRVLKQFKHTHSDAYYDQMLYSDIFKQNTVLKVKNGLFALLYEAEQAIRSHAQEKKNPLVKQVEQYLKSHFHKELTLQILSLQFHVNNVYLGRLFKEETGQLFSDYLNKLRIDKAKEMLVESTIKAAEIGTMVGFSDPNYFYRKFKQTTGLSPTEFRRTHLPDS